MNATGFIEVLTTGLLTYLNTVNSNPRFMQDNDPKHTLGRVREWSGHASVNWWKTPAESPDLNPIENLLHELKEYFRRVIKLKTKQERIHGIIEFWDSVDINKTRKYISHVKKVVPKIIGVNGSPAGY